MIGTEEFYGLWWIYETGSNDKRWTMTVTTAPYTITTLRISFENGKDADHKPGFKFLWGV